VNYIFVALLHKCAVAKLSDPASSSPGATMCIFVCARMCGLVWCGEGRGVMYLLIAPLLRQVICHWIGVTHPRRPLLSLYSAIDDDLDNAFQPDGLLGVLTSELPLSLVGDSREAAGREHFDVEGVVEGGGGGVLRWRLDLHDVVPDPLQVVRKVRPSELVLWRVIRAVTYRLFGLSAENVDLVRGSLRQSWVVVGVW